MNAVAIPVSLVDAEDDLTILTKKALERIMREEKNPLLDDKETMKAIEAQAKAEGGVSVTDALKALHRQWRAANAVANGAVQSPSNGEDSEGGEPGAPNAEAWKLVVPAIPLRQLGHDCFLATLKYRDLDKLSVNADVQRPESKKRIPQIADYVDANNGYFGAVIVTAKGASEGLVMFDNGELIIEQGAIIDVNDGQHRVAGIKRAIAEGIDEERLDDDLPLLVYTDLDVTQERQLFADINENAKKPPKAITNAFDERNLARRFAHDLVKGSVVFRGKTNFVKTRVGPKDKDVFTFSNVVDAIQAMWPKDDPLTDANYMERLGEAVEFWRTVDAVLGATWDTKTSVANTKNALVAIARLNGVTGVELARLGTLDWASGGELDRVVGEAGGTNAAVKALYDTLVQAVVAE